MIKVAIIGAGAIANTHIEGLLKFQEKCQIVAIADIYADKAREKVTRFGLDASVYEDYKKLFAETRLIWRLWLRLPLRMLTQPFRR